MPMAFLSIKIDGVSIYDNFSPKFLRSQKHSL